MLLLRLCFSCRERGNLGRAQIDLYLITSQKALEHCCWHANQQSSEASLSFRRIEQRLSEVIGLNFAVEQITRAS